MEIRKVEKLPVLNQVDFPPLPREVPPMFKHGGWQYEQDGYGALAIFAACVVAGEWKPVSFFEAGEVAKGLYPNQGVSALLGIGNLINEGLVEGLEFEKAGYVVPRPEMVNKVLAQYRDFYSP